MCLKAREAWSVPPAHVGGYELIAQFHVPVGDIEEVLPVVVATGAEIELHERTPLGLRRLAEELHARLGRSAVRLARIALDTGADDVLPRRRATPVARDDVVEIQVAPVHLLVAVLAGIVIALEDVMPGEFDFLLRQAIKHEEHDHLRHTDAKGDGGDAFRVRLLLGKVFPLREAVSLEFAVLIAQNDLRLALKEKSKGASRTADIYCLPEAIQHEDLLVKE